MIIDGRKAAVVVESRMLVYLIKYLFSREKQLKMQDIRKNVKDAIVVGHMTSD